MRDIVELLKKIEVENGRGIWLENYEPPTGIYIKVDVLGNILDIEENKIKNNDAFINSNNYEFYRDRMFNEGMLDANKCVDVKNKKIHSVTSNSLIMKYQSYLLDNIDNIIKNHFSILDTEYNMINANENRADLFIKVLKNIKNSLPSDIKKDIRMIFMLDVDLDFYEEDYNKYLDKKIYVKNDTERIINGESYGVMNFSNTINDKKPFYSNNPYSDYAFMIKKEELLLINRMLKIKCNKVKDILRKYSPNINIDFILNANSKQWELSEYSSKNISTEHSLSEFRNISILSSTYEHTYKEIKQINQKDLIFIIDSLFGSTSCKVIEELLRNNLDWRDCLKRLPNDKLAPIVIQHHETFKAYFQGLKDVDIILVMEKMLDVLFAYKFNESDLKKPYEMTYLYDRILSILIYLDKDGGYKRVANTIKAIWNKLLNEKSKEDLEIESDEEFFFLCGQAFNYLSSLNKTDNKTGILLQDVFNIKNMDEAKEKLINKYDKYKYIIPLHSKSFINVAYNALISYKIIEDVKMDKLLKKYYQAGLVGKNIFYTKKKENDENKGNE